MTTSHTDLTELIRADLGKIFENEPLGLDQPVEYAITFPVLPGADGSPQISFLLILAIPSVIVGQQISSGRAWPGLRPSYGQLIDIVRSVLEDLFEQKDAIVKQTMASSNGQGEAGENALTGVPRFDLSGGLPPV